MSRELQVPDAESEEQFARWVDTVRHPVLSRRTRRRIWRKALARAEPTRVQRLGLPLRLVRLHPAGLAFLLALAIILSPFGTVLAAQGSMPGHLLYPVKRASEEVWMAFAPDSEQPTLAMVLAFRRMEEIEFLATQGMSVPQDLVASLAESLDRAVQGPDPWVRERVQVRLQHHIRVLELQVKRHPENPGLQRVLRASQHALDVQSTLPPSPPATPTPPVIRPTPPGWDRRPWDEEHIPPGLEMTPPGYGGTPPGQQQTPPGQEHIPLGQEKIPPGQEHTPPGQEHTPPGQEKTPPGQEDRHPATAGRRLVGATSKSLGTVSPL